jgi:hypothetical protein
VTVYVDLGVVDDRVEVRAAVGDALGNMVGVGCRTKYSAQDTNDRKIKNITIGTYDRNVLIITPLFCYNAVVETHLLRDYDK